MSTNARRTERYAKADQDFITQRECKQLVAYAINRYDELKRAERWDRRLWTKVKRFVIRDARGRMTFDEAAD